MATSKLWRVFAALVPPREFRPILAQTVQHIRSQLHDPELRWVPPDLLHLTLRFYGSVPVDAIPLLADALAACAARSAPFTLRLAGWGAFPHLRRARTLWLGLGADLDRLASLHRLVVESTSHLGDRPDDDRPFQPHLTIARVSAPRYIPRLEPPTFAEPPLWRIDEFHLVRSHLLPDGPRYETIARLPLPPHGAATPCLGSASPSTCVTPAVNANSD